VSEVRRARVSYMACAKACPVTPHGLARSWLTGVHDASSVPVKGSSSLFYSRSISPLAFYNALDRPRDFARSESRLHIQSLLLSGGVVGQGTSTEPLVPRHRIWLISSGDLV
jgi:hypothetical protein